MRLSMPAGALGLCLVPLGVSFAATPAPTSPAPVAAVPATDAASLYAAKHGKRTACLKEAKAKKLVGADKNTFVKDCMATP